VPFITARVSRLADVPLRMTSAPNARTATGSPRVRRLLAIGLGCWALFAVACATTTAPRGAAPEAGPLYGAPRATESFDFAAAPPLATTDAPDAAPILDESPAEPSSLFLAREILAERAPELDELQKEGVARAVVKAEQEHGLPALLVLALIEQESHFRPKARGPGGSLGLMQLMPASARAVADRHGIPWQGARTLHDPVKNVHLGVLYLAEMRDLFGSPDLAMAAYNIGPGAVQKRLAKGLSCKGPYVSGVLQRFQAMRLIFGDPTTAIGG
jgi:soluble lytic murein transglycosylase-like protein